MNKSYEISEIITIIKDADYLGLTEVFNEAIEEIAGIMNQFNPLQI